MRPCACVEDTGTSGRLRSQNWSLCFGMGYVRVSKWVCRKKLACKCEKRVNVNVLSCTWVWINLGENLPEKSPVAKCRVAKSDAPMRRGEEIMRGRTWYETYRECSSVSQRVCRPPPISVSFPLSHGEHYDVHEKSIAIESKVWQTWCGQDDGRGVQSHQQPRIGCCAGSTPRHKGRTTEQRRRIQKTCVVSASFSFVLVIQEF